MSRSRSQTTYALTPILVISSTKPHTREKQKWGILTSSQEFRTDLTVFMSGLEVESGNLHI